MLKFNFSRFISSLSDSLTQCHPTVDAEIIRETSTMQGTFSTFYWRGEEVCKMIELPWLDNQQNKSCIPDGVYDVSFMPRSASGKYKRVWHIKNVPNRGGILIHRGNYAGGKGYITHSQGCFLPGVRWAKMSGQKAVTSSVATMAKMRSIIGEEDFTLRITWR